MKILISNFRGISRAEIDTAPVTLLIGKNYQGKTSAIQGTAAVLTGNTIPIEDLPKSSVARLIHSGAGGAEILATTADGQKRIIYPECTVESTGQFPEISATAAGLESIVDIPVKQRSVTVSKMLNAEPGDAEIAEKMKSIGMTKQDIDKIMQTIHVQGWDAAHAHAKEVGAKLKGRWEGVTAENWGEKKAASWFPVEWEGDLQTLTEEVLSADFKQENEWLETAISDGAIQVSEIQRLETIAIKLPTLKDNCEFVKSELAGLQETETMLRTALNALPPAENQKYLECPHCRKPVCIVAGMVVIAKPLTEEEQATRRTAIDEAKKSLADLSAQVNKKRDELATVKREIAEAENAHKKSEEMKLELSKISDGSKAVDDCRICVKRAETRLSAWKKKRDADLLYGGIVANMQIIEILAPTGMRLDVLKKCLATFNGFLKSICECAAWRLVELRQDMSISMNGTPYMLLSKSEKFRVRCAMQVATAKYDGSTLVLIDEADVLDGNGRNGLMQMLLAAGIESVVGMTTNDKTVGEKIGGVGGNAYWIENGMAEKIG